MSVRIVEVTKKTKNHFSNLILEWDDFVYNHPLASIFQSSYYANIFSERFLDWSLIILLKEKGIVGGMLSQVWPYMGFPYYRLSNFKSVYGPLFLKTEENPSLLLKNMFNGVIKKKPLQHVILMSSYDWVEEIKNIGYRLAPHAIKGTFIVDLKKSEKEIWASLEKRCRYSIKHAKKLGVKISKINNKFSPILYYKIHLETVKRLNIPPNPLNFYLSIWRNLTDKFADFYFAFFDNKPIAGVIILKYRDVAYLYSSVLLEEYKSANVMNLLIWNLMLDLKHKGFKFFDLLFHPGKNDIKNPEHGLYLFKRSFGGKEVPIYHYEKSFSPKIFKIFSAESFKLYKIIKFL